MMMDQYASFFSEMRKIALSSQLSDFQQTRRGRRPLRVSTLLTRQPGTEERDESGSSSASDHEREQGSGFEENGES